MCNSGVVRVRIKWNPYYMLEGITQFKHCFIRHTEFFNEAQCPICLPTHKKKEKAKTKKQMESKA